MGGKGEGGGEGEMGREKGEERKGKREREERKGKGGGGGGRERWETRMGERFTKLRRWRKQERKKEEGRVSYKDGHTVVVQCKQPRPLGCHLPVTTPCQ